MCQVGSRNGDILFPVEAKVIVEGIKTDLGVVSVEIVSAKIVVRQALLNT